MASTCLTKDFFAQLRSCRCPVLLLDYDGTLAPFTTEREQAKPYPEVIKSLQELHQTTGTRIIFVTGRTSRELDKLLRPYGLNCEIWGVHGRQRLMPDGTEITFEPDQQRSSILQHAAELMRVEGFGADIEVKPFSLAIHWRGFDLEEQRDARVAALRAFAFVQGRTPCRMLEFDGGLELLTGDRDKGYPVRAILKELPPLTPVAYLGDDISDEDAFLALGDAGITVLVRDHFRPTAAEVWIKPPEELVAFLRRWRCACGGAQ